jgi:hypothetical protein
VTATVTVRKAIPKRWWERKFSLSEEKLIYMYNTRI